VLEGVVGWHPDQNERTVAVAEGRYPELHGLKVAVEPCPFAIRWSEGVAAASLLDEAVLRRATNGTV
jgi:hypothetical protein